MLSKTIFLKSSDFWNDFGIFFEDHWFAIILFFLAIIALVAFTFFTWLDLNEQKDLNRKLSRESESLYNSITKIQSIHKSELESLTKRLNDVNHISLKIVEQEFNDIILSSAFKEIQSMCHYELLKSKPSEIIERNGYNGYKIRLNIDNKKDVVVKRLTWAIEAQYRYEFILDLFPELDNIFVRTQYGTQINKDFTYNLDYSSICSRVDSLYYIVDTLKTQTVPTKKLTEELYLLKNKLSFLETSSSNLTAIPYMAQIMADYETYGLEKLAKQLDWGYDEKRLKKVKSIREIRQDAKEMVEKNKEAQYQLAYLLNLFPNLEDIIDAEFSQLPFIDVDAVSDYDRSRDYLSKEEYQQLSSTERNQLALDRYMNSHNKTKWQIGRDYEIYVGYEYSKKGYDVDYFGSYMGFEDLGRDLIAKKDGKVLIIQCKYWSRGKQIHEKHITQLFGTVASYCIEHKLSTDVVSGVLITNIKLSDMAKKMAAHLKVSYIEKYEKGPYPCIKCNISYRDGEKKYIYHLPFDQQYDSTKIDQPGEFFAETVAEAEAAGFRRAFKWFGSN